ncbi:hypothetical protein ACM642_14880 [Chryseobacterium sp. CY353]|nr:hypothetical protein [Chryseobacterium sp. CY353]
MKNKKYSIQICIYLFLLLMWNPYKSQEILYYNTTSSGSKVAEFYKINSDSSIYYTRYHYRNGKEEMSTGREKNGDNEAWKRFLNNGKLISLVKTETPESFKTKMMHKTFLVEQYGEKKPLLFYGNTMIMGTPTISPNIKMIYPRYITESGSGMSGNYQFREIHGIHFLIYQEGIYLLQNDKIIQNLFPIAKITSAASNTGNTQMSALLKVNDYNQKYSVSDNIGKTVLPAEFEDILICADAILAKKNNLWYFYDLFGKRISKKGYRKILPLAVTDITELVDQIQTKTGSALKYVVLDGKEVKVIDDIYKESKDSKFSFQYGELSVCGTRTGSYTSQSINLQLNDNKIIIKEKTYFQNYYFTDLDNANNYLQTEKTQEMALNSDFGKLEFFQKEDGFTSYGSVNNQWIMLLKRVYQEKEYLFPVSFIKETNPDYYSIRKPYFEPEAFDKIEVKIIDGRLLVLEGDYNQYNLKYENLMINNNFKENVYYKLTKNGKYAFYSPLNRFVNSLDVKYTMLGDLKNRFMRFSDENGKEGWLSEDGQEFYD